MATELGKTCTCCGEFRKWDDYTNHLHTKDGKQSWCRFCKTQHMSIKRHGHPAFRGVTVDHLYWNCPSLVRAYKDAHVGSSLAWGVDPEGTDVCGLCKYKWRNRR